MREWRNWQTRTFEGRVVYTVRVQVPFLAPTKKRVSKWAPFFFFPMLEDGTALRASPAMLRPENAFAFSFSQCPDSQCPDAERYDRKRTIRISSKQAGEAATI